MNAPSNHIFSRRPTDRPTAADVRAGLLQDPGFGKVFTDHMVTIRWTQDRGWHDAEVRARAPIALDPAAAVLHYGQEIFEGLKAYNFGNGSIALFRPEQNARRFLCYVDSAAVYWNASTRFSDGAEFGFGAEMGISTQKLHCRGPFALAELTSTKYEIIGSGQVRS